MGKIKDYIHDLAELAAEALSTNLKPEHLDHVIQEQIKTEDEWDFYLAHKDLITSMAIEMLDDQDDEPWTDPAGGTHYPGEDPAAMYESIIMQSIEDFE